MIPLKMIKAIFQAAKAIITGEHFVYAQKPDGWYHGSEYVSKDALYAYRRSVKTLCKEIAEHFKADKPEVVIGPTIGAISLKDAVADYLSDFVGYEVLAVYADEEDVVSERIIKVSFSDISSLVEKLWDYTIVASGKVSIQVRRGDLSPSKMTIVYQEKTGTRRVIKRGYDAHVKNRRCLLVEDVVNSGATLQKTAKAVVDAGGILIGAGALCNRSGGKVSAQTLGLPKLFSLLDLDMKMYKEEECPICKEGKIPVRTDLGKGKEFLQRIGKL